MPLTGQLVFVDEQDNRNNQAATVEIIQKCGGQISTFCRPTITLWVTATAAACDSINKKCGQTSAYTRYRPTSAAIPVSCRFTLHLRYYMYQRFCHFSKLLRFYRRTFMLAAIRVGDADSFLRSSYRSQLPDHRLSLTDSCAFFVGFEQNAIGLLEITMISSTNLYVLYDLCCNM